MFRKLSKRLETIQITSDLHLEYHQHPVNISTFLTPKSPNLAILGDLGYPTLPNFKDFLKQVSKSYDHVFYVSGNHEYYNDKPMDEVKLMIHDVVSEFNNIYFLDNDAVYCDNVKILGTTLWTKILPTIKNNISNDHYHIKVKKDDQIVPLSFKDVNDMYYHNVKFLETNINNDYTLVLTHHLPSYQLITPRYKHFKHQYLFASSLDYLVRKADIWCSGHTHEPIQLKIGDCLCAVNPYGYHDKYQLYNKELVIKI
jgi:predicted phosphodiesterase